MIVQKKTIRFPIKAAVKVRKIAPKSIKTKRFISNELRSDRKNFA